MCRKYVCSVLGVSLPGAPTWRKPWPNGYVGPALAGSVPSARSMLGGGDHPSGGGCGLVGAEVAPEGEPM